MREFHRHKWHSWLLTVVVAAVFPAAASCGDSVEMFGACGTCPEGQSCTPEGTCAPPVGSSQGSATGGSGGNGASSGQGGTLFGGGSGPGGTGSGGEEPCAEVTVAFDPVIPTVVLLLDQSGSMNAIFTGAQTRWQSLYTALMDPNNGVVKSLENDVRFGLALYTSNGGGPTCPDLVEVWPPALGNHASIDTIYAPEVPQSDTPTGDAIDAIVAKLEMFTEPGPQLIVLATDGEPDTCEVPNPQNGQAEAIAAAENAYAKDIQTVILAVGDDVSLGHQQDMANAGAGEPVPANCPPCAPTYQPSDPDEMVNNFIDIINGARTCVFTLEGEVDPALADQGTVKLNGVELDYQDADGWKLNSPSEIELTGAACDEIMNGGDDEVTGSFPCGAIIPD